MVAVFAWANGVIGFGESVPEGALPIVAAARGTIIPKVKARARLAYDNRTLLVPGIPEATTDSARLDALMRFRALVNL